jgi:Xanthine dehydrogenase, molybdopterin-binding subunit B
MTAFRGFGGPQGMVLIETVMGEIARHLHKDPLEVRCQNLYDSVEDSSPSRPRSLTHYGMQVEDNIAAALMKTLTKNAQYSQRRQAIDDFNGQSQTLKRG